jgi:hypothetical protein
VRQVIEPFPTGHGPRVTGQNDARLETRNPRPGGGHDKAVPTLQGETMPREELIDGVEVSMGGRKWTVPPLNLKQIKKFEPILKGLGNLDAGNVLAQSDGMLDVIHAAVARNYPEVTHEELEEMLDLGNLLPVVQAVMGVSGLLRGEAKEGSR